MSIRVRPLRKRWYHRLAVTTLVAAAVSLVWAAPAMAYAPVNIVHTERVQAGPYRVTLGFSVWPIRAMQSLDFTFMPDGGIVGKSGALFLTGPGIKRGQGIMRLVRHPRKRDSWGLDVKSLNAPGTYSLGFLINGPRGQGQGSLQRVTVLHQPGPPLPLSWTVGSLPFVGLVVVLAVAWRRTRPGRQPLAI
jgi:hypothetical protein